MTRILLEWDYVQGQPAQVYRNLNNGTMSVRLHNGKQWLVYGHETDLVLRDVKFWVGEGWRKCIEENRRNVHAWGIGWLVAPKAEIEAPISLQYNPFKQPNFLERGTGHIITACKYLVVENNLVFCSPDAVPNPNGERPKCEVWSQMSLSI